MRAAAAIITAITLFSAAASAAAAEQYTVAPHDTLYSIARRFGVTARMLADANGLRDPSRLRAGAVLVIPDLPAAPVPAAPAASLLAAHGARAGDVGQPPSMPPRQVAPATRSLAAGTPRAGAAGAAYTVLPGDTLYHLAVMHGVIVADLKAANHLSSDLIQVGQVLRIPAPAGAAIPLPQSPPDGPAPPLPQRLANGGTSPLPSTGAALNPIEIAGPDRTSISALPSVRPAPPRSLEIGRRITAEATRYLGTPYVWGGASPGGVDCSGLVYVLYSPYVPNMPRTSYDQWKLGEALDRSDLAPGDLVFFDTDGTGASHVGIYIGGGQFIHPALGPHRVVVDRLDLPYYASHYLRARRVL